MFRIRWAFYDFLALPIYHLDNTSGFRFYPTSIAYARTRSHSVATTCRESREKGVCPRGACRTSPVDITKEAPYEVPGIESETRP